MTTSAQVEAELARYGIQATPPELEQLAAGVQGLSGMLNAIYDDHETDLVSALELRIPHVNES